MNHHHHQQQSLGTIINCLVKINVRWTDADPAKKKTNQDLWEVQWRITRKLEFSNINQLYGIVYITTINSYQSFSKQVW